MVILERRATHNACLLSDHLNGSLNLVWVALDAEHTLMGVALLVSCQLHLGTGRTCDLLDCLATWKHGRECSYTRNEKSWNRYNGIRMINEGSHLELNNRNNNHGLSHSIHKGKELN
jgi:hypothetical protein